MILSVTRRPVSGFSRAKTPPRQPSAAFGMLNGWFTRPNPVPPRVPILPDRLFINMPGFLRSGLWHEQMEKVIAEGVRKLNTGQIKTHAQLVAHITAGYKRTWRRYGRQISPEGSRYDRKRFGMPRTWEERMFTIEDDHGVYFSRLLPYKDKVVATARNVLPEDGLYNRSMQPVTLITPFGIILGRQFMETARFHHASLSGKGQVVNLGLDISDENKVQIYPAPPYSFPAINADAALLFNQVRAVKRKHDQTRTPLTPEEAQGAGDRIAKIHWLMARSAQADKGSAGIADCYSKTMHDWLEFLVPPWKPGHSPDMDAFVTPKMNDYAADYTSGGENGYFARKPYIPTPDEARDLQRLIGESRATGKSFF